MLGILAFGLSSVAFSQTAPATPASTATATPASDANKAEFKFSDETHDFGTVVEGTPTSYEFVFTNVGKEPLILTNAVGSCGCTTPKWSKEPIAPGKTGSVTVTYDSNRVGPFNKSVTLSSNAKTPSKVIIIKGVIDKKKA